MGETGGKCGDGGAETRGAAVWSQHLNPPRNSRPQCVLQRIEAANQNESWPARSPAGHDDVVRSRRVRFASGTTGVPESVLNERGQGAPGQWIADVPSPMKVSQHGVAPGADASQGPYGRVRSFGEILAAVRLRRHLPQHGQHRTWRRQLREDIAHQHRADQGIRRLRIDIGQTPRDALRPALRPRAPGKAQKVHRGRTHRFAGRCDREQLEPVEQGIDRSARELFRDRENGVKAVVGHVATRRSFPVEPRQQSGDSGYARRSSIRIGDPPALRRTGSLKSLLSREAVCGSEQGRST